MALGLQGAPRDKNSELKKNMIRLSETISLSETPCSMRPFLGVLFIDQRAVVSATVAIGWCN